MINKFKKYITILMVFAFVLSSFTINFAALSISEDAMITKSELNTIMSDLNTRLSDVESNINNKIDALLEARAKKTRPIGYVETSEDPNFNPNGVYTGTWEVATRSVLVELKVNGNGTGYKIYGDGWCEQWGTDCEIAGAAGEKRIVTLLKPYIDTTYVALALFNTKGGNTDNTTVWAIPNNDIKQNEFLIRRASAVVESYDWYTCGMTNLAKAWVRVK